MKNSSAVVVVLALILASCGTGPSVTIKNQPCMGCLNGDGLCLLGNIADACGAAGAMCVACGNGTECVSGACVTADGGMTLLPPPGDGGFIGADGGLEDCSEEAKLISSSAHNPRLAP